MDNICECCGGINVHINAKQARVYNVRVCESCLKCELPLEDDQILMDTRRYYDAAILSLPPSKQYQRVTKTVAKEEYLLKDNDFIDLPFDQFRSNQGYLNMVTLYLTVHLMQKVLTHHETWEQFEEFKQDRKVAQFERKAAATTKKQEKEELQEQMKTMDDTSRAFAEARMFRQKNGGKKRRTTDLEQDTGASDDDDDTLLQWQKESGDKEAEDDVATKPVVKNTKAKPKKQKAQPQPQKTHHHVFETVGNESRCECGVVVEMEEF